MAARLLALHGVSLSDRDAARELLPPTVRELLDARGEPLDGRAAGLDRATIERLLAELEELR